MRTTLVLALASSLAAAPLAPVRARDGVELPAGDRGRGLLAFRRVGCAKCHVLPEEGPARGRKKFWIQIPLGQKSSPMADGELATELILPSRRIHPSHISRDEADPGKSPMPSFAAALNLQELSDLVAFLRPRFPRSRVEADRRVGLPKGDRVRGEGSYLKNGCGICHRIDGIELATGIDQPTMEVVLGGPGEARPSRGELATEIVEPDHRVTVQTARGHRPIDADSPMPTYARRLSMQDLADLVTFLRPAYRGGR